MFKRYYLAEKYKEMDEIYLDIYMDIYEDWGNPSPKSFEEFKEYAKQYFYEPFFIFTDIINEKETIIGIGFIYNNNVAIKNCTIAYAVHKDYRKRGYGDKIIKELINFSQKKFGTNLIIAETYENVISEKLLKNNNFVLCGILPKATNKGEDKIVSKSIWYLEIKDNETK